ncbi:hypothetical protein [Cohnella silvisoli]|uniref:Uncharacterized protein n=1 Tax=Cohnella silvisoli TaxID=2873699 RepID=A0ABV1L287_9BACL|nr:hypothetical protein [Cohnella silvisoli]MCD9025050.1 hypothetical protein [Cohnella silvisoli]
MYDYISIHSDTYTQKIKVEVLEQYLTSNLGFAKVSYLTFLKDVNGELVKVTGIPANPNGSYDFITLEGIEEVNLVEIDVPRYTDDILEQALSDIARAIAKEFSWIIDDDHGLN